MFALTAVALAIKIAATGGVAIRQYQAASGNGTSTTPVTVSLPSPSLAGSTLVLGVTTGDGFAPTITDDKSNTWTTGPTQLTSGNASVYSFYKRNATAGTQVITASFGGTVVPGLYAYEISSAATSGGSQNTLGTGAPTGTTTSGTVTAVATSTFTTVPAAVILFVSSSGDGSPISYTAHGGYTLGPVVTDNVNFWGGFGAHQVVSATTAITASWDFSGFSLAPNWAYLTLSFN